MERKADRVLPYIVAAGRGIMAGVVAAMITAVFAWALCDFFRRPAGLSAVLISLGLFVPGYLVWDGGAEDEGQRVIYTAALVLSLFMTLVFVLGPIGNFLDSVVKLL